MNRGRWAVHRPSSGVPEFDRAPALGRARGRGLAATNRNLRWVAAPMGILPVARRSASPSPDRPLTRYWPLTMERDHRLGQDSTRCLPRRASCRRARAAASGNCCSGSFFRRLRPIPTAAWNSGDSGCESRPHCHSPWAEDPRPPARLPSTVRRQREPVGYERPFGNGDSGSACPPSRRAPAFATDTTDTSPGSAWNSRAASCRWRRHLGGGPGEVSSWGPSIRDAANPRQWTLSPRFSPGCPTATAWNQNC